MGDDGMVAAGAATRRGGLMARIRLAAVLLPLADLVGCTPPPPPPPTVVALTLTASADANANAAGQGAPVQIRLYQLAAASGFGNAEFFQLLNQDQATLGADLVKRDDIILAPGQSKTLSLAPTDQVKALGVFAAYQNFQGVTWRASAAIPPHQTSTITITAGHDGISAAAKPGP
jgi:type VI secretion system protein VasD